MRVFITGATGFIGTELAKELIDAGHQVRGLARSEESAKQLLMMGVEVHRGDLTDQDSLKSGAKDVDAVVNLAFDHDFTTYSQNAENEIRAIEALGSALDPGKLLIVTAGLLRGTPGQVRTEKDPPVESESVPRRPEQAAQAVAEKGVHVVVVRLPQVHDTRKQGMVTVLRQVAREKGVSAYIGSGANRWSAAPLSDVKHLYRLAMERALPGITTYHAVQEEGVALRDIADALAEALGVPTRSISTEDALQHFGPFLGHIAAVDLPVSSQWTQKALGWEPVGPGLLADLMNTDG